MILPLAPDLAQDTGSGVFERHSHRSPRADMEMAAAAQVASGAPR